MKRVRVELVLFNVLASSPPPSLPVPTGSFPRSGDAAVYVLDINQPSSSTPFYSVLVSISVWRLHLLIDTTRID